jgi:hypothetical protein
VTAAACERQKSDCGISHDDRKITQSWACERSVSPIDHPTTSTKTGRYKLEDEWPQGAGAPPRVVHEDSILTGSLEEILK